MNATKNKSICNVFIVSNMAEIISAIKTGIKYMYVENMFANNEEISIQELCRLNDEEFRYQVKTAVADFVMNHANAKCLELERYISRMSTKQMKKKFNFSELNNFYLDEVSKQLHELN